MPQAAPPDFTKPTVLYHASQDRQVRVFEPRAISKRKPGQGPRVFAALDKPFAAIFLHPFNDAKMASGFMTEIPYVLVGDVEGFKQADRGGAIYTLPSDSFEYDAALGVGYKEWTSKLPVTPIAKEEFDSALEAMLDLGVQVYFADMPTLKRFQAASDEDKFKIIAGLQSENEKLNRNHRPII